jgi:hypothetical protein
MTNSHTDTPVSYNAAAHQPWSSKWVVRVGVILVVSLALSTGLYQALYKAEQRKYLRLEDKYVRVRDALGTEKTQELIDQSRQ